jgi:hypothetical protein
LLEDTPTNCPILQARESTSSLCHHAQRVDQQMPLPATDRPGAIEAAVASATLDRLDGLAVQDGGGALLIANGGTAHVGAHALIMAGLV